MFKLNKGDDNKPPSHEEATMGITVQATADDVDISKMAAHARKHAT